MPTAHSHQRAHHRGPTAASRWQQRSAAPRPVSACAALRLAEQQHAARLQQLHGGSGQQQRRGRQHAARRLVARAGDDEIRYVEGYTDVEEVLGIRVAIDANDLPQVTYLVKWKDGEASTWEPAINLSEDLIRDYDERWWSAARQCNEEALARMLGGGRDALAQVVDENRRSALHFVAALGNVKCAQMLIEAGADLDLQDAEGYTPLHMAAGYMRTATMTALLEAGADPEIKDKTGRDVVSLVDNLRGTMKLSMQNIQARLALEEVANCLTRLLYEEVPPQAILDSRTLAGGGREFLVQVRAGGPARPVNAALLPPRGRPGRRPACGSRPQCAGSHLPIHPDPPCASACCSLLTARTTSGFRRPTCRPTWWTTGPGRWSMWTPSACWTCGRRACSAGAPAGACPLVVVVVALLLQRRGRCWSWA
jgi:hypothetical protein